MVSYMQVELIALSAPYMERARRTLDMQSPHEGFAGMIGALSGSVPPGLLTKAIR